MFVHNYLIIEKVVKNISRIQLFCYPMKASKKIPLIIGVAFAYILIVYMTFSAIAKVHRTNNPALAKRVVILTFFADVLIFGGSAYMVYKLKAPVEK